MSDQITLNPLRAVNANGLPVAAAQAFPFLPGTTTPTTVFTSDTLSTPHPTPIVANGSGVFPAIWVATGTRVKIDVRDPATGNSLPGFPLDPAFTVSTTATSASGVAFAPITGVPVTNVQAAIAQVQSNITSNTANITTLVQTGGSGNAYTLTAAQPLGAYAVGQMLLVRINHQNSGAATINVDSLGARDIQKYDGTGALVALASADLRVGDIAELAYDGTRFVLLRTLNGVARSYIDAQDALRGPIPTLATAVGQWTNLFANVNVALNLPAGGTWAYKVTIYNTVGEYASQATGVAAGGTAIVGATNQIKDGFAWRIA